MGIESASPETRKDMVKRLEEQKIRAAFANLRDAGIKSFAFFIFGYPGDTPDSLEATTDYAIDLDSRLRELLSGGALSRHGAVREGAQATACWPARTGRRWSTGTTCCDGNGLNEQVVMAAINRAKRRFFLRPRYLTQHLADAARLAWTKPALVTHLLSRVLFGQKVVDVSPSRLALPTEANVRGS